jgi:hypothetical protein
MPVKISGSRQKNLQFTCDWWKDNRFVIRQIVLFVKFFQSSDNFGEQNCFFITKSWIKIKPEKYPKSLRTTLRRPIRNLELSFY